MVQNVYKSMRGMFAQVDPSNKDSDVSPQDLKIERPEPSEDERDLVALVKRRFDAASSVKQVHVREWLICQAFRMGNQWVEWRRGELFDLRDPDDNKRNYQTIDQIDRLLKKLKARATMSKPDASVKPLTSSDVDRMAAAEARDVLAHYDGVFNRQEQSLEWVDSVLSSSTTFLKIIWDPTKRILGPTPEGVAEYQELGDIDELIVPPFEVYPDPAARNWSEVTWLIHAKDRPLSYIQAKYGKRGFLVDGRTQRSDSTNWAEQRLDNISGDSILPASNDEKVATVYECWELPTPRYPKGRLLRVAGNVLLTEPSQIDWPYKKNDEFPFVPLMYEKRPRGLWSLNAVTRLIKPQMAFNKAISRMQDRVDNDKVLILEPRGAETGADNDYVSPSYLARIKHNPGVMPQVFEPSPFNEALLAYAQFIRAQMEDISGVHEVSNGAVPPGITAGNAIELLQQSDQSQMSEFVTCMETAQKKRAEWEIALVSQFYSEPRLIAVSQLTMPPLPPAPSPVREGGVGTHPGSFLATPPEAGGGGVGGPPAPNNGGAGAYPGSLGLATPPEAGRGGVGGPPAPNNGGAGGYPGSLGLATPPEAGRVGGDFASSGAGRDQSVSAMMAVRAFEGLTRGGQVHIEVVPGSATPKTPAAMSQQILDLASKGFFTPQMLPVLKMVADQIGLNRSDIFVDRVDEAYAAIMSNTPPPEVAQQRQQQQAQQVEMLKAQAEREHLASMEAVKTHAAIEIDREQTDNKIRLAQATALAQAHAHILQSTREHAHKLEHQTNEHHHEVAMMHVEKAMPEPAPARSSPPLPVREEEEPGE